MKVYLDNCVFNRPFDDQQDLIVHVETIAKLAIQQMVKDGNLELLWSDILYYENDENPFDERHVKIAEWVAYASDNIRMNSAVIEKTKAYMKAGLKSKDAAHVACAVYGGADYFITVDKRLLNKPIGGIAIIDPVAFLRRLQNVK